MSDTQPGPSSASSVRMKTERTVARGALINLLGVGGKMLLPLFIAAITHLFGPSTVGLYLLAFIVLDVAANLTVSGINDGILMLATREDVVKREQGMYQILANGFALSLAAAAALIVASRVGGPWLITRLSADGPALVTLVEIMALSLPFRVVCIVVIAATKVKLTMKWDALLAGFGRSGLLLLASVVAYLFDQSAVALAWAYVVAWASIGAAALFVFPRYYSYRMLLREFGRFRISAPLVRFAIPQNLNMAFGRFATDIDVMMLAFFGVSKPQITFYWVGGQIVRNLRQIKLIFSGVYAPIIVRLHMQGDPKGMNRSFSTVSRWSTTLALPATIALVFFRGELIWLFHHTFTDDTTFMLLLLVAPLLSCIVGLASNIVVMTGHAKWNLANALGMAALNLALNYALIPHYGLLGAAAATATASLVVTIVTLIEAQMLVGAHLVPAQVYKPLVAGVAAGSIVAAWFLFLPDSGVLMRSLGCVAALATYFLVLIRLGVAEEDLRALVPWKRAATKS